MLPYVCIIFFTLAIDVLPQVSSLLPCEKFFDMLIKQFVAFTGFSNKLPLVIDYKSFLGQ